MKKIFSLMATAILMIVVSCNKTDIDAQYPGSTLIKGDLKSTLVVPFIIGQNETGGEVDISDNADGITINAVLSGWEFKDNHIYVGSAVPPSHSPGQFPYSGTITSPNTVEFFISFDDLGTSCGIFYVAFQADVYGGGGGWAIPETGALHWYNKKGNQIGWGAYFVFNINCGGEELAITPATGNLSSRYTQIRFRNLRENGPGDEIYIWPDEDMSSRNELDFDSDNNCSNEQNGGRYLFYPEGNNHISLTFWPGVPGIACFLTTITSVTDDFCTGIVADETTGFDAIQFMILNGNDNTEVHLKNITINGQPLAGDYEGQDYGPSWNITGPLLNQLGICILEADIELINQAPDEESNLIEFRFGKI